MSDPVTTSRSARESLARGLNALQADPSVPSHLVDLAAPIAQAMGALHQLERTSQLAPHAEVALNHLRGALSQLQAAPAGHPAVNTALEAVAQSLTLVHSLSRMAHGPAGAPQQPPTAQQMAPQPVAPQAPPPQQMPPQQMAPQAPPQQMPPQQMAPQAPPQQMPPQAPPQQVPPQAPQQMPPQQMAPQAPPQQMPPQQPPPAQAVANRPATAGMQARPATGNQPVPAAAGGPYGPPPNPPAMVARDPFASPAPVPATGTPSNPKPATPSMPVPAPPTAGNLQLISADLGAHSPTNFYKGLSGNDIIDHGGLFVSTYVSPQLGTPIRLKVSLPGGYEFEANAVVRWTREAGGDALPGFGAQFTAITPEARQLVYRYVRNREPLFHDDL